MMSRAHTAVGWLLSTAIFGGTALAAPAGVSPGAPDRAAPAASSCPTFSWAAAPGSGAWELVVYRAGAGASLVDGQPVLRQTLPGGATSWTPPLTQCLRDAGTYAWAVRRTGERGDAAFSPPLFFTTPATPGADEIARAMETLRQVQASRREGATRAPRGKSILASDSTAVVAENTDTSGKAVGLEGSTASSNGGSAGVAAIATATTGPTVGIVASQASPQGMTALLMTSQPGSLLILGKGPPGNVFEVDAAGAVTATSFVGDGASLSHVDAYTLGGHFPSEFMPSNTDNWVNTTGDTMTGDLSTSGSFSVAGNFLWSAPRTFYRTIDAAEFAAVESVAKWERFQDSIDMVGSLVLSLQAPIHVPDGAQLSSITLYVYDNDAAQNLSALASCYRRGLGSETVDALTFGNIFVTTAGASTSTVAGAKVVNPAVATVDNQNYSYVIDVTLDVTGTSQSLRFYGARVAYTLAGPAD